MEMFSRTERIVIINIYAVVVASSIILNLCICYLIIKGKVKRTNFTLLLMNLSVADIGASIGLCPYVFINNADIADYGLTRKGADYLCSITAGQLPFWVCTGVSVFTLCLISFNRYLSVNHPRRLLVIRRRKAVLVAMILIWIFGIVSIIPSLFAFRYNSSRRICKRHWPESLNGQAYVLVTSVVGMGLPFVCLVYTFLVTVRTLWFKKPKVNCRSAAIRVRKRVTLLLGTLIFAFTLCWAPFTIYWIASRSTNIFPEGDKGLQEQVKVNSIVLLIGFLNTILNPIIYGFGGREFRRALTTVILRRPKSPVSVSKGMESGRFTDQSIKKDENISTINGTVGLEVLELKAIEKSLQPQVVD